MSQSQECAFAGWIYHVQGLWAQTTEGCLEGCECPTGDFLMSNRPDPFIYPTLLMSKGMVHGARLLLCQSQR